MLIVFNDLQQDRFFRPHKQGTEGKKYDHMHGTVEINNKGIFELV
jgi:hypothetical protein